MTKSPRKNVPDVGIELVAACMPSGRVSDRANAPEECILAEMNAVKKEKIYFFNTTHFQAYLTMRIFKYNDKSTASFKYTGIDMSITHTDTDARTHAQTHTHTHTQPQQNDIV